MMAMLNTNLVRKLGLHNVKAVATNLILIPKKKTREYQY